MNIYRIRQMLKTQSIYETDLAATFYARVSSEKEEQKNSLENQQQYFEDFIKKNPKWHYRPGYIDDGISGIHVEKREEFQKMIADAKAGKFDLIITKEISRFARNTLDSIKYTRELLNYGVCVWFTSDGINTIEEDSELRLTIMAGVAQDEIRKLSSRVRFGHAQAIKNGVVLGNSHIYGYDKKDGKLTVNEEEARMVRLIFTRYASGRWSTPRLEKLLYELGYRNYKGGKISRGVIRNIIRNPKYKGYYVGGKVKIIDMFTKKQEFLPEEEWNMFKDDGGRVPAIVDEETWELANRYFKERGDAIKSRRTSFKHDNLFTGKLICAMDSSPYWMKQHQVRGSGEDVRWVCSHRIRNGAASCSSFPLAESELRAMTADVIQKAAGKTDSLIEEYLALYQRVLSDPEDHGDEIARLKKEILSINRKKDKILDYNLNGAISDREFISRNNEFNARIDSLTGRLKDLEQEPEDAGTVKRKLCSLAGRIREYARITAGDLDPFTINELFDRILVTPTGSCEARIDFVLKSGEIKDIFYNKKTGIRKSGAEGCSDHTLFTI